MPYYSKIPDWCIKEAPVAWELELRAGLALPFSWAALEIPPLAAGTLSLLELAGCHFLMSPSEHATPYEIMLCVHIAREREKCHELCQQHRRFHEQECAFDLTDTESWSDLDCQALELARKCDAKIFCDVEQIVALWKWFDVSFNGYAMIHGGTPVKPSAWRYGVDSLASYLSAAAQVSHESVYNLTWRVPVALMSHMIARHIASNDPSVKLYRELDHGHVNRLRSYIKEREDSGKLLYWQEMRPCDYELSEAQCVSGGEDLVKSYDALRKKYEAMTADEREERAKKILTQEGIA